jgi:hypothetical protein
MDRIERASLSTVLNKVNEIVDWCNREDKGHALIEASRPTPFDALIDPMANVPVDGFDDVDLVTGEDPFDQIIPIAEETTEVTGEWRSVERDDGEYDVFNPEGKKLNDNPIAKDEAKALLAVMDRKVA